MTLHSPISPNQIYLGYKDLDLELIKSFILQDAEIGEEFITDGFSQKTLKSSVPFCNSFDMERLTYPVPEDGFHAEALEYFALCDSINRSDEKVTIVELGAGWGPWISLGGVLARNKGISNIHLIGVEADAERFSLMKKQLLVNHLRPDEDANITISDGIKCTLIQGAVSKRRKKMWFPQTDVTDMGSAATEKNTRIDYLGRSVNNILVDGYTLSGIVSDMEVDFLHIDIQGMEYEIIKSEMKLINSQVKSLLIGTHSRIIEGNLMSLLYKNGWNLYREKPCKMECRETPNTVRAMTLVDGIQYWLR